MRKKTINEWIFIFVLVFMLIVFILFLLNIDTKKDNIPNTNYSKIDNISLGKQPNCDIVFTSDIHSIGIDEQGSELYCINSDGTNLKRITNNDYFEFHADVSPKRQEIITVTLFEEGNDKEGELDTNSELVLWDFKGEIVKRLTNNNRVESVPHWSPDGEKIVFFAGNKIGELNIYTINRDGSDEKQLTSGGVDVDPSFSPDGEIIFSRGNKIMIIDEGNLRTLTELEIEPQDPVFIDSNTIAFESVSEGNFDIYLINKDGTNLRKITYESYHQAMPQPMGEKIVYWTVGDKEAGTGIWIMDKDGNNKRNLIEGITNSQMPTGNE